MKKHFVAAFLTLSAFSASSSACTFNRSATEDVLSAIENNGGWAVSDQMCAFLNKNRLSLEVLGESQVLAGVSIGWAVVGIIDRDSNKRLNSRQYNTLANKEPSSPIAMRLLATAVNNGIRQIDLNLAAKELATSRGEATRKK